MTIPSNAPQSVKQAQNQLQTLRLPVPDAQTLLRISRYEGSLFKNAIVDAGQETSPTQQASRNYLTNVMTAYSPVVMETFRRLGYGSPEPQQFMAFLKEEGRAVRAAVRASVKNNEDTYAKNYLLSVANQLALPSIQSDAQAVDQIYAEDAESASSSIQMATQATYTETASVTSDVAESSQSEDTYNSMSTDVTMDDYSDTENGDPSASGQTEKPTIESSHIYGRQGAFCFTKNRTQTGSYPTISIDAARCIPNKEKSYDWKNKIAFQLTVGELPLVFGVFYGFLNEVKLIGHGKANNKSFSIVNQDKNYYLTMQMGKESSVAIPAIAKDTFKIMGFMLEQMKANFPSLDGREVIAMARRVCDIHLHHNSNKQAA